MFLEKMLGPGRWGVFFIFVLCFRPLFAQSFGSRVDKGQINFRELTEASGIAASRKNPGVLWTHNDSGGKSRLFALDTNGRYLGSYYIAGARNRDWEDIAVGPGPTEGESYIYIADIGDNSAQYDTKYIYRIPEPRVSVSQTPLDTVLYGAERLPFQYPEGNRNAETVMVDPLTRDLFVISKERYTCVYRAAWPQTFYPTPTLHVDTLAFETRLPLSTVVGGDISPDGLWILIKRKDHIFYWKREAGETIRDAFQKSPKFVPYVKEPQGEAVCWAADLSGYYTISEGLFPHLYFYPRLKNSVQKQSTGSLSDFQLRQNCPNPFNTGTEIPYTILRESHVTLAIFSLRGRLLRTLVDQTERAGTHRIFWDGTDRKRLPVPSGVYFCRLQVGEKSQGRRLILLK